MCVCVSKFLTNPSHILETACFIEKTWFFFVPQKILPAMDFAKTNGYSTNEAPAMNMARELKIETLKSP